MINYSEILKYFPLRVSMIIDKELKNNEQYNTLEEIRLRTNRKVILKFNKTDKVLEGIIKTEDILETIQHICDNSIYSYQNQICNRIYNSKRRS